MFMLLIGALLASAVLLRHMPLLALAVTLAGLAATSLAPKTEVPASALQVVVVCAAVIEVCYMAATRTRAVSVTGVVMASVGLPILILELPPVRHLSGTAAQVVACSTDERMLAMGPAKAAPAVRFEATLYTVGEWTILRLPGKASNQLLSPGQVAVQATVNGHAAQTVVEPDARTFRRTAS